MDLKSFKVFEKAPPAKLADALRVRAREGKPASGDALPVALVKRLLAGESPVRVWREHRGLTAARVAAKAEITASYLSEIETGRKEGSLRALRAIARVLKVDLGEFDGRR